jgi:hypothetical protein
MPSYDDTTSDLIATPEGFNAANFYYSYYHQTYVNILHIGYTGSFVSHSTNGKIFGKRTSSSLTAEVGTDPGCEEYGDEDVDVLPPTVSEGPNLDLC